MTVDEAKVDARRRARERLRLLGPERRATESRRLVALIEASPLWQAARRICLYWPLATEPDIRPLLQRADLEGREIGLPAYLPALGRYGVRNAGGPELRLVKGPDGALEPGPDKPIYPLELLDLVLAPGLAFAPSGARLGRGGGWYDRLLSETSALRCGVAFIEQIEPELPAAPHDARMDWLATPEAVAPSGGRTANETVD